MTSLEYFKLENANSTYYGTITYTFIDNQHFFNG